MEVKSQTSEIEEHVLLIYCCQIRWLGSDTMHSLALLLMTFEWNVDCIYIISLEIENFSLHLHIVQNLNLLNTYLAHTV